MVEDHPVVYVDSNDYYHAYAGANPMFDNELKENGNVWLMMVLARWLKSSPKECLRGNPPPNHSLQVAALFIASRTMASESEIIARFLQGAVFSAAKISGDVTAIVDASAYRLAGRKAPDDVKRGNCGPDS